MIITRQKSLSDILECLKPHKKIFLVGCTLCATTCKTGGEDQIKEMEKILQKEGKTVTGWAVLDPACSLLEVKRLYRKKGNEIDDADAILSLACGGGTQALTEIIKRKEVYPGNDTLFQGEITEASLRNIKFEQKCSLCGECVLAITGNLCPVTRCPKGLLNGPCGGVKDGKCEVDKELDCVWVLIYERLKELGRIKSMKEIRPPKDYSKNRSPQDLNVK